jgi:Zn-dependent protease
MAIITILEIVYLIITTVLVGYIFTGYIPYYKTAPKNEDELYRLTHKRMFDWEAVKFTMLVAAPGIILHELSHKFTAMYFGLETAYHIFWEGMILGVVLKLFNSPFLLLAPGFVQISGNATIPQTILIAFAGPFVNLVLWLGSWYWISTHKNMKSNAYYALTLMKQINMILFIFNMIPIPGFDGFTVFSNLYKLFF